jgi:hypothetical protein
VLHFKERVLIRAFVLDVGQYPKQSFEPLFLAQALTPWLCVLCHLQTIPATDTLQSLVARAPSQVDSYLRDKYVVQPLRTQAPGHR